MPARSEHAQYELLEPCGQGGMGIVFRARDRKLNRIVALKFVGPRQTGSADALLRFTREAQAIAALNHPNIATLFEAGEWDGEPFLALEFLPNGTLRDKVHPGGLPLSELLHYAAQIGAGLEFAHSHGILHRDIKPANCMISQLGILKLVDFGLAKTASAADITQPGSTAGTVAYLSPEVLRGGEASAQSDIYAFGATLYELAAGVPLFSAPRSEALAHLILSAAPRPLASIRPDLPEWFTSAVMRAVAGRADARFASVGEFLDAIHSSQQHSMPPALQSTETIDARSSIRPSRFQRWRIAALALACLVLASFEIYHWLPRSTRLTEATLVVLPFENLGGDPANQALCDGLQEAVSSTLAHSPNLRRQVMIVPSSEIRRNRILTIADARKQFKADLALTGTVQRTNENLQLTLNLSDAASQRQKDSRAIVVPSSEAATLQSRLAAEIGELLGTASEPAAPLAAGATTRNSQAYDFFLRGRGALESRDFDKAIDFFRKSLDLDPDYAAARTKLAEAYLRKNLGTHDPKWLSDAEAEAARAARAGETPDLLFVQAMIRKETGDPQQAIELFHRLLDHDADNIESYSYLADALEGAGRIDEAVHTYQKAISLRPGYWPTYRMLGDFYFRHHDYPNAEQTILKALGLSHDNYTINTNLGVLYFAQSRWEDAARCFERSIAAKPNATAYSNLGTVYFFQRRYAEAAHNAREATKLQPANPLNWGNLGDALRQIPSQRTEAVEAYQKAALLASEQLALTPANWRLRKSYALYLAKLARPKEAISEIERTLKAAPRDGYANFYAARVYSTIGNPARAATYLQQARAFGVNPGELAAEPDVAALLPKKHVR